ncbi:MAG: hypothetical protein WDW36_004765 [Sanguina aurantia]
MGSALRSVTSIHLDTRRLHVKRSASHDSHDTPRNCPGRFSMSMTQAARAILSALALVCPSLQRLTVLCRDAHSIIPHEHLGEQLHTLTLALPARSFASNPTDRHAEDGLMESGLRALLPRLTSLTLSTSFPARTLMPVGCIARCTSLTYLDCGSQPSTAEMWAVLPRGLRELRCKLDEPPSQSSCDVELAHLRRCVFQDRGGDEHLSDLTDVLALAPNLTEVALLHRFVREEDLFRLVVHISNSATLAALTLLHARLSSGLQLITQHPSADSCEPHVSTREVRLLLTVFGEPGEEDQALLSQYLTALQPCPLFTDVSLFSGPALDLRQLPATFPNLSRLVLDEVSHSRQFLPLVACRCLQSLELFQHGRMRPRALAKAVLRISSLTSFRSALCTDSSGYSAEECLLLAALLSEGNPSLSVTVA